MDNEKTENNKFDKNREIKIKVVDKRSALKDEESGELSGGESAAGRMPSYVESLQKELEENKRRMIELSQLVRNSQKENEDFRVRMTKDIERRVLNGKITFIKEFLELLDNLERGLSAANEQHDFPSFFQGIDMVRKQFHKKLKNNGVNEILCIGEKFDPKYHEAISTAPVEKKEMEGIVLDEAQKGYLMDDQVLRPSVVVVGKYERQE